MNLARQASKVFVGLAAAAIVCSASPFRFQSACAPIDVSVDGEGYLRLSREGRAVYSKSVRLAIAANGKLATPAGDALLPSISAPAGTTALEVDLDGNVFALNGPAKAKVGRIVLALFAEGTALSEQSGVLVAADRPKLGNPGDGTNGVIRATAAQIPAKSQPVTEAPKTVPTEAPKSAPTIESAGSSPIKIDPAKPTKGLDPLPAVHKQPAGKKETPLKIVVSGTGEVAGDKVTLGDIATVDGDEASADALRQIELGDAPVIGAKRSFDRIRILAKIRSAGFDPNKIDLIVPATISVERKGQSISQEQFNAAALKAIAESPGIATEYVAADAVGPDFLAPAGSYALVPETISGVNTASALVKIAVYVGVKKVNSRSVKLTAKSLPVSIRVGSAVKVLFRAGGAMVEVQGIARGSGTVGDTIPVEVKLPGSEKTNHAGIVLKDGSVEVKL